MGKLSTYLLIAAVILGFLYIKDRETFNDVKNQSQKLIEEGQQVIDKQNNTEKDDGNSSVLGRPECTSDKQCKETYNNTEAKCDKELGVCVE